MIKLSEIDKGFDQNNQHYTVTLKINDVYFEATAYSEKEQELIYKKFEQEVT